jgi:hypothetical protein
LTRTLLLLALTAAVPAGAQSFEAPALRSGQGTLAVVGGDERSPLPAGVLLTTIAPAGPEADWLAAGTEGETRLVLVRGDGDRHERIAPPRETAATVAEPLPVTDERGRLVGLAWLAGRDRDALAVRFAPWEGDRWGRSVTVAPPGPGSQLALAATARGGTVVLAWSRFDGQDDEILVSRRSRGRWSAPRPITDNSVPDVTPAVAADRDGFLVVWSGFSDGEYRLFGSRFRGDTWQSRTPFGPPGSLFPSLVAQGDEHLLLYRDVHARAWTVTALDATGRAVRRTRIAAGPDASPVLLAADRDSVRLFALGREHDLTWETLP